MSYVASIGVARLSSKEKTLIHDRGRNFDPIVTKLGTNGGLIKIQTEFVNELCGAKGGARLSFKKTNLSIFCFINWTYGPRGKHRIWMSRIKASSK